MRVRDWLIQAVTAIEHYRKAHVPPLIRLPLSIELLAISVVPSVLLFGLANMLWPRHVRLLRFLQEAQVYLGARRGERHARFQGLRLLAKHMRIQPLRWALLFTAYCYVALNWLSSVLALLQSTIGRRLMRASPDLPKVQPAAPWIVLGLGLALALLIAVRGRAPKLGGPIGRLPIIAASLVAVGYYVLRAEHAVNDGTYRAPLLLLIALAVPVCVACNRRVSVDAARLNPPSWVRKVGDPGDPSNDQPKKLPSPVTPSRSRLAIPDETPAVPRPTRLLTDLLQPWQRSTAAAFNVGGPHQASLGWDALTPPLSNLTPDDPRDLGPYKVRARISAGGMGTVFLATHSATGAQAAVKVPTMSSAMSEDELQARLLREIRVLGEVNVPGVARLLDSGVAASGTFWVAMDYVKGPTLEYAVEKFGRIAHTSYLHFFSIRLAELIGDLHSSGIMHRDIKPSNIILTQDGPVIIDLGISVVDDETAKLTQPGHIIGTLTYMPPEVLLGKPFTPAGDVYAWGCVAAYAALGAPLFTGERNALPSRIMDGVWDDGVAARLTRRDPEVAGLVRSTTMIDPQSRPGNGYLLHGRCVNQLS